MRKTIKAWVSGKVQGVFYRASAQKQAMLLGIDGYAKNLADGRVEVLAQGEEQGLQEFVRWLHQGPEKSRVAQVETEVVKQQAHIGFMIL